MNKNNNEVYHSSIMKKSGHVFRLYRGLMKSYFQLEFKHYLEFLK